MQQYVTYKIDPEKYKKIDPIKNGLDFILSGGNEGVKNYNLLFMKQTETRLIESDLHKLARSKTLKFIENTGIIEILNRQTHIINEFLDGKFKRDLYDRFSIPKRSGGLRWIDAPQEELKSIQKFQQYIMEHNLKLLTHHNAHAYIKDRSIATNAYYHKNSNHFARIDFKKFFPSITKELLEEVLPKIGIFAYANYQGMIGKVIRDYLKALIRLATLDDCLPQGTPISPVLSNLIMIPFDYHLTELLKEEEQSILVTRYADDLVFSSFYAFADRKEVAKERLEGLVNLALARAYSREYIRINEEKTSITTKFGKNRVTGIKVNADNNISIGYKEKRKLKQNLAKLIIAKQQGNMSSSVKMEVIGYYNFLHAIEPEYANYVLDTLKRKFNLDQPVIYFLNN